MKKIRLDKYLSVHTELTRSQIKKKVAAGLVKVGNTIIKDAGYKVSAEEVIELEGQQICGQQYQYLLFHKPAGIVSATEDAREDTVLDVIRRGGFAGEGETPFLAKDLFPMGRLDKDTEGLLILTNDGELAHRLLSPKFHVEKTYFVRLDAPLSEDDVQCMREGIDIGEKRLTKPAVMKILTDRECYLTITEGKFHQIKRMFHKLGKEVVYLKRVEMAEIRLEDSLKKGEWRQLTQNEIIILKEQGDGKKEILCGKEGESSRNLSDME
ncbi:MAG: pseudouridine synthase [Eubacterium sp.]